MQPNKNLCTKKKKREILRVNRVKMEIRIRQMQVPSLTCHGLREEDQVYTVNWLFNESYLCP